MRTAIAALAGLMVAVSAPAITANDAVIYTKGAFYTVDSQMPWAQEVRVEQGKIVCVGAEGGCRTQGATLIDLGGKFVMPGVVDSHTHLRYAPGTKHLSVADATSREEFRALVNAHAARFPELEWITGDGWNYAWFDGGLPDASDLDGLAGGKPILLVSYDAHTTLLNQAAMEAFGINRDMPNTETGAVQFDADGDPTGIVKATLYVSDDNPLSREDVLPPPDEEDLYQSFLNNLAEASSYGITTFVEPQNYPEDLAFFERARRENKLNAYAHLALYYTPGIDAKTRAEYRAIRDAYASDPQFKVPAVKLYIDDVIESETAALFEPYAGSEDNRGALFYEPEEFKNLVTLLDDEGFQIFIHAIGDRGIGTALDALEAARTENGAPKRPHQLVHVELIQPNDVARMAALDISGAIQPRHMSPDVSLQWAKSIGEARLKNAWPLKSMQEAGVRLAFSSDWNVVEMNPMTGIYTAVTRKGLSGEPIGGWQPQESIDVATAIYGYTQGGAITNGIGEERGSIAVGKFADMIVLDQNLFEIPADAIKDVRVMETFFEGRSVFKRPIEKAVRMHGRLPKLFGLCTLPQFCGDTHNCLTQHGTAGIR